MRWDCARRAVSNFTTIHVVFWHENRRPPEVPLCRMVCQVCCVILDRNLPLAQCSWSSASHSVERKWRTAKNNLPGFHWDFCADYHCRHRWLAGHCSEMPRWTEVLSLRYDNLKFNEVLGCKCSMFWGSTIQIFQPLRPPCFQALSLSWCGDACSYHSLNVESIDFAEKLRLLCFNGNPPRATGFKASRAIQCRSVDRQTPCCLSSSFCLLRFSWTASHCEAVLSAGLREKHSDLELATQTWRLKSVGATSMWQRYVFPSFSSVEPCRHSVWRLDLNNIFSVLTAAIGVPSFIW